MAGFKKAQRQASKFKGSIQGASGSGKTFTALNVATALVALTDPGKRIAVIDTEESAALYAPPFDFDADSDFGTGTKKSYSVEELIKKMEAARTDGGYGAVIIDSATHFWKEAGGLMSKIDEAVAAMKARGGKGDSFAAWKSVDPIYRKLMNYIRTYPMHVIMCVRAKQAYEKSEAGGKGSLRKVGMEPEFRDGFEYEMDAQFAIDQDHVLVPLKHRLGEELDGKVYKNPGKDLAEVIASWLTAGAPGQEATEPAPVVTKSQPVPKGTAPVELEENAPDTTKAPETQDASTVAREANTEITLEKSAVDTLLDQMKAAPNADELKAVGNAIKKALSDKRITHEEYTGTLSAAFKARQRELAAATPAAA